MENSINERIRLIFKQSDCRSMRSWGVKLGIAQTSLSSLLTGETEPKFTTLHKILIAERNISPAWLMLGEGDMYLQSAGTTINIQRNGGDNSNVVSAGGDVSGNVNQGSASESELISKLLAELSELRKQNTLLTNKLLNI